MYKKVGIGLVLLALFSVLLAACSIHTATGPTGPTVHMANADFVQHSITIKKGDSLTLVDDVAVEHIITNGSWVNSVPKSAKESGAPTVNVTLNGNDTSSIGPFPEAGTFKLYCTIHPGMNLTVTVQ